MHLCVRERECERERERERELIFWEQFSRSCLYCNLVRGLIERGFSSIGWLFYGQNDNHHMTLLNNLAPIISQPLFRMKAWKPFMSWEEFKNLGLVLKLGWIWCTFSVCKSWRLLKALALKRRIIKAIISCYRMRVEEFYKAGLWRKMMRISALN